MTDDSAAQLTARGEALIQMHRPADALAPLGAAIGIDPTAVKPRCLLALALDALKRSRAAEEAARAAVAVAPDNEWAHRVLSAVLYRAGRPRMALAAAEEAVRIAPNQMQGHVLISQAALVCQDWSKGQQAADAALRLSPDSSVAHSTVGAAAMGRRDWRTAEAASRRALELDATNWEATNNLGVALLRQHRGAEAVEVSLAAARMNPRGEFGRRNVVVVTLAHLQVGRPARIVLLAVAAAVGLLLGWPGVGAAIALLVLVPEAVFVARLRHLRPTTRTVLHDLLRGEAARRRLARPCVVAFLIVVPASFFAGGLVAARAARAHGEVPLAVLGLVYGSMLYLLAASPHYALVNQLFPIRAATTIPIQRFRVPQRSRHRG